MIIAIFVTIIITAFVSLMATRFFYKKKYKQSTPGWFEKWGEEVVEKIAEAIPDAVYIIDKEHRMRDVLNYKPGKMPLPIQELVGKLSYEYMDEENSMKISRIIDQTFETDEVLVTDYSASADGHTIIYYEGRFKRINKDWIICIAHDITQTYLYEQGLIESKEELEKAQAINQLILNNASCGLVYIDLDFVVQFENLRIISQEGFDVRYAKGEYCYQRIKGRNTPCENCIARKALQANRVEKENLIVSEDLCFEVTASPVLNPDGSSCGVVLKYDNMTVREQAAKELQRAKEAAEASDKLKSQFLSNMSHEIRTPLNAIVGFSELLMTTDNKDDKAEYVSIIKRSNELLLQLINDILDISRIESDRLEFVYTDIQVNDMLRALEASSRLKLDGNPDVKIVFNPPIEDYVIRTEPNRMLQVLSNFVNNSIKFTEKGTIEIGYTVGEKELCFYVSDTGMGIPQEKQSDVFKRFVKLNEFANGTGLGLSICASIIKRLNGKIGVDSIEGKGSTFWFTLPC